MEAQVEFETLVECGDYIRAVNLARQLEDRTEKKPFQDALFLKKNVFLKSLQQAVKNGDQTWLGEFLPDNSQSLSEDTPNWFRKIRHYPEWCSSVFSAILKAQIICAKKAISHPEDGFTPEGWKNLAKETGFSIGFVYELFHWLKKIQLFEPVDQREIPILLDKGRAAEGQAAYLIIEQVALAIPSSPYPHPIKMAKIPLSDDFQAAVDRAFTYVNHVLMSQHYDAKAIPSFRWWIQPAANENAIQALNGPSLYGSFTVGMLSLIDQAQLYPNTAITCDGNESGYLLEIGGLAQKCQAAGRQQWDKILLAEGQDKTTGDNKITHDCQSLLVSVNTVQEALKYFTSGIGFEVIDYLNIVYQRWGKLSRAEVPSNSLENATFEEMTKPMKVRVMGTDQSEDWEKRANTIKRCVIYGWEKVGKTRLLKHEGRKISGQSLEYLTSGQFNLEQVNIPILLSCSQSMNKLAASVTFEEAIFAILKEEYLINQQTPSQQFLELIKNHWITGHCCLLIDDFIVTQEIINKINIFYQKYPQCRIILTLRKTAKNKKEDDEKLPLEIGYQADEIVVELISPLNDICPYKGLQFFEFNDEDPKYFYGRDKLIEKLLNKVQTSNFLAVLGSSGSGKSSVVRAGVLHQLTLGTQLPGSEQWAICQPITPTSNTLSPFRNLKQAFTLAKLPVANNAIELTTADSLIATLDEIPASRILLTIDQFEEIFTCSPEEQQQFFDCLLGALAKTGDKFCLIIAIRDDFRGKCANYPALIDYIDANSVTVTAMDEAQIKQAITEPAKTVGLGVEDDLVTQMLKDMKGSASKLPLLQDVLEQLWKQHQTNWLTVREYVQIGGIDGALKERADKLYESLSPEEQATTRWIFQNLTHISEGIEEIKNTRQQVFQQTLITEKYSEDLVESVLKKLKDARLVVTSSLEQQPENHQ